jgi:hypothetical protein
MMPTRRLAAPRIKSDNSHERRSEMLAEEEVKQHGRADDDYGGSPPTPARRLFRFSTSAPPVPEL